jgi:hypothetical protein
MKEPKSRRCADPPIELLLRVLADAYEGKSWHGPNLRGSVRGVPLAQALWRPGRGRHNIAEITLHTAYWKYAVRRRLRGEKRGSFPLKGSNWFALLAAISEGEWKSYVRLLDEQHRSLLEAVREFPPTQLQKTTSGGRVKTEKIIYGIAAHDVYHTGQIRLLKALQAGGA